MVRQVATSWIAMGLAALSGAVLSPSSGDAAESCGRTCLQVFADRYLDALAKHDASVVQFAAKAKVTENGKPVKVGEGLWKIAGTPTIKRYALDPETGGAAVQALLEAGTESQVVLVRLKIEQQRIVEAETVYATSAVRAPGVWYDPEGLKTAPVDFWQASVPPAKRQTRDALVAAASSYFRGLDTVGQPDFKAPDFAEHCDRYENGKRMTNVPDVPFKGPPTGCIQGFVNLSEQLGRAGMASHARHERFPLVDVERGIVLGMAVISLDPPSGVPPSGSPFGSAPPASRPASGGGSAPLLVADLFKIEDGKIREAQVTYTAVDGNTATGW